MMPDRIGTIGRTQGVNASSRPAPKNVPTMTSRLDPEMICARRACSDTGAAEAAALTADSAPTAVASGSDTLSMRLAGG